MDDSHTTNSLVRYDGAIVLFLLFEEGYSVTSSIYVLPWPCTCLTELDLIYISQLIGLFHPLVERCKIMRLLICWTQRLGLPQLLHRRNNW